jgi:hypothetical protein
VIVSRVVMPVARSRPKISMAALSPPATRFEDAE